MTLPKVFAELKKQHIRNFSVLLNFIFFLTALIAIYSAVFHLLMFREGRAYTWFSGFYWTITTMSTVGLGDIVFVSDLGKLFTVIVELSGLIWLIIMFPFTFIQFFYEPWMNAQSSARTPRELSQGTAGHVILTHYDQVTAALIDKLNHFHYPYVLLTSDKEEAIRLYELGLKVVYGDLNDPETYRKARVRDSAMVATTADDIVNTHVAFTVREVAIEVPIIATANTEPSVDVLKMAGSNHVLELAELMGQALARRTNAGDTIAHVVGHFGHLLIAEATAAGIMVGKTLRESDLRRRVGVTVLGIWERGRFDTAGPDTTVSQKTVLVLAGTREQLKRYDELFKEYSSPAGHVVIIGGGRVGRATARALARRHIDYQIVEKLPERFHETGKYILGDASNMQILRKAGIMDAPTVIITTHDIPTNVYLTIFLRRLRPDIEIISRSGVDKDIAILHRAGADFIMSYASMGANAVFNYLKRSDIIMVAEGLDLFKVHLPAAFEGKSLNQLAIREKTGCGVVAIKIGEDTRVLPDPDLPLPEKTEIILIGGIEGENKFLKLYGNE